MLLTMGDKYKVQFTESDIKRFLILPMFGVPMSQLTDYIRGDEKIRGEIDRASQGIPMDSTNNQLGDWIAFGWNEKQVFQQTNEIPK